MEAWCPLTFNACLGSIVNALHYSQSLVSVRQFSNQLQPGYHTYVITVKFHCLLREKNLFNDEIGIEFILEITVNHCIVLLT